MANMLIKYEITNEAQGFDLGLLGESFSGTNKVLNELAGLTGIKGEIEVRGADITHGSIDLHNAIFITLNSLPFNSPQELMDFLQVVSPELYREAREFFSGALGVRRDLNDYFAGYAFDAVVLAELAKVFIAKAWGWAGKQKQRLTTQDVSLGDISQQKATRLRNMVSQGKFRKVLKPMTEGNVKWIKVKANETQDANTIVVNESDIENYLPAEDQILPQFINGTTHTLTGVLQNLQSARGEIIKIKVDGIERRFSLITAMPPDGRSTEDYLHFYHQHVTFKAEVVRASMYKRPEFVIREMSISQQELLPGNDESDS